MDAISKYCPLFLRETPNPIPICFGTMSHEQRTGAKQFETIYERSGKNWIILDTLSRFLVADNPGWEQKVTSQGKGIYSSDSKKDSKGQVCHMKNKPRLSRPALGSVCYFKKYFLQVLSVRRKDGCKNATVQEAWGGWYRKAIGATGTLVSHLFIYLYLEAGSYCVSKLVNS